MMENMSVILTAVLSFAITAGLGYVLIPYLKRLKYGQPIKTEDGPTWHQVKQGTPTMGGIMFIAGIIVSSIIGYVTLAMTTTGVVDEEGTVKLFAGLIMALGFGLMGYVDDYIKVVKKRNLGLRAKQKMIIQILIAVVYLFVLYMSGSVSTIIEIPFLTQIDIGLFYYPFMVFIIVAIVNAVNLTDGIDGLASSVTMVVGIAFMTYAVKMVAPTMGILAVALAAGCLGFLCWNFHPAKVFMGDTGSMFLGGMIVALAFGIDMPILIIIVGFVYFIEVLSVVLQVISFQTTGKRIFKMSPIHHHFEMSGWCEEKIVIVFSIVAALFGTIGYFGLPL